LCSRLAIGERNFGEGQAMQTDECSPEVIERVISAEIRNLALMGEDDQPIAPDEDFLVNGLIDSFAFISFLKFAEDRYGIVIEEEEQFDDRLRSIKGMTSFISEKLNGA
jgi:acyl carrier protein